MSLIDTLSRPWAILPETLGEMKSVMDVHSQGPKLDLKALESRILEIEKISSKSYEVINGAAIIPVKGALQKNPSAFFRVMFGSNSMVEIKNAFLEALSDADVEKIILDIDSPGGTVDGTQELAQAIFENRGKKPVLAYSDGYMTSAAYWIGAAADSVFLANNTVTIGSIGVIAMHVEYSEMDKRVGVKTTEIVSGKWKNAYSDCKPLSDEARDYIQERVDYIFGLFIESVAKFRGVSTDEALKMSDDARLYIGRQAIDAGLADSILTIDYLINAHVTRGPGAGYQVSIYNDANELVELVLGAGADGENSLGEAIKTNNKEEVMEMTAEILSSKYPEVYKAIFEQGKEEGAKEAEAKYTAELEKAVEEARAAETQRVKDVKAQLIPGHEALIDEMMFDGKTTGAEAAVRIVQAEKSKGQNVLDQLKNGMQPAVKSAEPPEIKNPDDKSEEKGFMVLVKEYREQHQCSFADAMKAVEKSHPEAHEKYITENNKGGEQ